MLTSILCLSLLFTRLCQVKQQLSMVPELIDFRASIFLVSLPIHGYGTRIIDLLMFSITRGRTIFAG